MNEDVISIQIFQPKKCIQQRSLAFREDLLPFFQAIQLEVQSLQFSKFKQIFKEKNLQYIGMVSLLVILVSIRIRRYCRILSITLWSYSEQSNLTQLKMSLTNKINIFLDEFFVQEYQYNMNQNISCIYLLYVFYFTQVKNHVHINISQNLLQVLIEMVKFHNQKYNQDTDFLIIVKKLLDNQAFSYEFKSGITTCLINKHGEPQFGDMEKLKTEMESVQYEELKQIHQLKDNNLKNIKKEAEKYFQLKKKVIDKLPFEMLKMVYDEKSNRLVKTQEVLTKTDELFSLLIQHQR